MKQLIAWTRQCSLTAILFTALFSSLATAASFRDDWLPALLVISAGLLGTMLVIMTLQIRQYVIPLILVLALLAPTALRAQEVLTTPPPVQKPPPDGSGGGCAAAAAGVVVVLGAAAVYLLYKLCQKKFPKKDPLLTNSLPDALSFPLPEGFGGGEGGGDVEAAVLGFGEIGSCAPECDGGDGGGSGDESPTRTFIFDLRLDQGVEPNEGFLTPLNIRVEKGEAPVQDFASFVRDTEALGVRVTGHAGDFSYARNGQPIAAQDSAIQWDPIRQVAKVGRGSPTFYLVIVESSADLVHWTPLLKTEIPLGQKIRVCDTTVSGQRFYRYLRPVVSD